MRNSYKHAVLTLCLFLLGIPGKGAGWDWPLEKEYYSQMSMHERAEYNRARDLLQNKEYKAAAASFEKSIAQFPNSSLLSYMIFMKGYSQHQAGNRHTAVKSYNEVLDFFGNVIEDAAPALYFLGVAHMENGDTREGLSALKEMVEDADYRQHELAAGALRRLADNYWKNKEPKLAMRYWKQAVEDFQKQNPTEAKEALENIIQEHLLSGEYNDLQSWWLPLEDGEPAARKMAFADTLWDHAWRYFYHKHGNFTEEKKAFVRFFESQAPFYEEQNELWKFYTRDFKFITHQKIEEASTLDLVDNAIAFVASEENSEEKDSRFALLAEELHRMEEYDLARNLIARIQDPVVAGFATAKLYGSQNDYQAAAREYEEIEKRAQGKASEQALEKRAYIYRVRLDRQEEAIKLYRQLANPPHNLWNIADCYRRAGNLSSTIQTYTEIENSFPRDAPRAAWSKADRYHHAGEKDKAIASARRILKLYPKSRESSAAHQLLEKYGINTGGGLIEE